MISRLVMYQIKNMKKLFILLLFVIIGQVSFGQVYQLMPQYGYEAKRMSFDSTLQIPTICGTPMLRSVYNTKRGAIAFDSCNNRFYTYNPKTATWSYLGSGGGGSQTFEQVLSTGNLITQNDTILFNTFTQLNFVGKTTSSKYDLLKLSNGNGGGSIDSYLPNGSNIHFDNQSFSVNNPLIEFYTPNFKLYNTQLDFSDGNFKSSLIAQSSIDFIDRLHYLPQTNQTTDTLATLDDIRTNAIDSIKRNVGTDSVFAKKNGTWIFQYTDSIGGQNAVRLVTNVYNNSGSTITKGSVVYINGRHSSNLPTIALAQANTEQNSYSTFALVENDIPTSSSGIAIQAGNIGNLNLPTATYTDGQIVYLSPTTAGGITTTKPLAPNHIVKIGTITRAHPTFGSIELKIENGWQMDELSDVQIASVPADSTLLQFSRVDSLWHDVSVTNAIGTKYIKPSDTASMLTKYLRKTDTTTLSNRINLKVNISDTATMLSTYQRSITAMKYTDTASLSNRINTKVNISDTAAMLQNYQLKTPQIAYLSADFNTTNTTATNTNLTIPVEANTAYRIMISGTASKATSSTGMKISIGAPTGTTIKALAALGSNAISTIVNSYITAVNSLGSTFAIGVGVEVPFRVEGILVTGSTSGSITLQGATVTSNTATIYANTLMTLTKAYAQ